MPASFSEHGLSGRSDDPILFKSFNLPHRVQLTSLGTLKTSCGSTVASFREKLDQIPPQIQRRTLNFSGFFGWTPDVLLPRLAVSWTQRCNREVPYGMSEMRGSAGRALRSDDALRSLRYAHWPRGRNFNPVAAAGCRAIRITRKPGAGCSP